MSVQPQAHVLDDARIGLLGRVAVLSVDRLAALGEEFERLLQDTRLSPDPVFRGYLGELDFRLPQTLPGARAVVIVATFSPPQQVELQYRGRVVQAFLPGGYYQPDFDRNQLMALVRERILGGQDGGLQPVANLPLKMLAVRSGLGKYGRNNICYVDGLGSFISLRAYYTDSPLEETGWCQAALLEDCHACRACLHLCPMGCISEDNFIVDIGRCITLFNEGESEFPEWLPAGVHHALAGCMRCQWSCPANRQLIQHTGRLEAISEEETEQILHGAPDEALLTVLSRKLKGFPLTTAPENFPHLRRNVKALFGPE